MEETADYFVISCEALNSEKLKKITFSDLLKQVKRTVDSINSKSNILDEV